MAGPGDTVAQKYNGLYRRSDGLGIQAVRVNP
jgi:hypothetical protein